MPRTSAGLLMYRLRQGKLEVLLAHPGGPFWKNKDAGAWTIPKGEVAEGEPLLDAAKREFEEETGTQPTGQFLPLTPIKQKSGKTVHAWAFEGDLDLASIKSNTCKMEYPPKSGKYITIPEIDQANFFDPATALEKINPAQAAFIHELQTLLAQ